MHDRAHAALAVLAPAQARELTPPAPRGDRRLPARPAAPTRRAPAHAHLLASSPAGARDWARALAAELAPLARPALPEIPAGREPARAAAPRRGAASRTRPQAAARAARAAPRRRRRARAAPPPSSRVGGALLLAAIVAAVVVGDRGRHRRRLLAATKRPPPRRARPPPPNGESRRARRSRCTRPTRPATAPGIVEVLSEGGKRAFYIAGRTPPADTQGLLLRRLALQLADQRRAAEQEPRRSARATARRRRAAAEQRRQLPTRSCSRARPARARRTRAGRPARAVQPARLEPVEQLAGVHDPGRVELGLHRRAAPRRRRRRSRAPSTARGRARPRGGG